MHTLFLSLALFAALATGSPFAMGAPNPTSFDESAIIQKMSLRKKVGQLFIFGFMGDSLSSGLGKTIESLSPGALIVFGRNIKSARQISNLCFSAQELALRKHQLPLLIAVDQEGGNVIRIRTSPPLPSALALGETGSVDLVRSAGLHTGSLLKTLGFNVNLAPVLDISDPGANTFIGTRTFGRDPRTVSQMGRSFAEGLRDGGVLPTAKHFPGHGGVGEDSHRETPEKQISLENLLKSDLQPYTHVSKEVFPWAVMIAHIAYPLIDPSGVPATYSKILVSDVLRRRLGFEGLVMTDDIEMAGAESVHNVGERAIRAIEAGVDLVMVAWNKKTQRLVVDAVEKAVRSGRISEDRLELSLRRILRAKNEFAKLSLPLKRPSDRLLLSAVRNTELRRVSEQTLDLNLKSEAGRGEQGIWPTDSDKIFVFSSTTGFYNSFRSGLRGFPSRFYRLTANPSFNINKILRSNPSAVGVFYLSGGLAAKQANAIDADVASRVIVINVETQSLLQQPQKFKKIVDVFFRHPDLGHKTAGYFFKDLLTSRRSTASEN